MSGLRWIGTARMFTQLVTWSLTIVTVRLLEPRDYGIVATSGLFTILAMQLMDGGLRAVLVSRSDLSSRMHGAAVTVVLLVSLMLAGVIIAIAPLGAQLFNNSALVTFYVSRHSIYRSPRWQSYRPRCCRDNSSFESWRWHRPAQACCGG